MWRDTVRDRRITLSTGSDELNNVTCRNCRIANLRNEVRMSTSDRRGTSKPTGWTNNVKVKCSKCGTPQYLKPGSGRWVCSSCGNRNGA